MKVSKYVYFMMKINILFIIIIIRIVPYFEIEHKNNKIFDI